MGFDEGASGIDAVLQSQKNAASNICFGSGVLIDM